MGALLGLLGGGRMAVVAIVGGAIVVAALWWQNAGLRDEVASLQADRGRLEAGMEAQRSTIRAHQRALDQWAEAYEELQRSVAAMAAAQERATAETRRLNEIFSEHDLGALAARKPGLVERAVNRGTSDALRVLGELTAGNPGDDGGPEGPAGEGGAP